MDDADRALALAEAERAAAIRRAAEPARPDLDITDCVDCGEEIAAARRALVPNAIRCTDCQAERERKAA